jgi:cold shock CspA family protein
LLEWIPGGFMSLIGKVLWWDERDGNGLIKDSNGRKYYFDSSVLDNRSKSKITSGKIVKFEINEKIKDSLCACEVVPITVKDKNRFKEQISNLNNAADFAA